MSKIAEMLVNVLLKKNGVITELRNFETSVSIPGQNGTPPISIVIKAENLQVRISKDEV